ncbi:hypothetical protein [Nocardia sp. NPDC127526]
MRDRPTGRAWQLYVHPGSRASHWLRIGWKVGLGFFIGTLVLLTFAVLT